jgi:hypothetical protein
MTQEDINDLLERPQPTCASMFDAPMYESPHMAAIAAALEHAKRKHPVFADVAVSTHSVSKAESDLTNCREYLEARIDAGRCSGMTVLSCEIAEASDAFARRDYAHTLEELAQCGAVIVRMMEAVQALVDEAAKAGKGAKE